MLKPLLKLRLAAAAAWFSGAGKKKNKPQKSPVARIILMSLLLVYIVACFFFLFFLWFDTLAGAWVGTELSWLYFAIAGLTAFALMFFFSVFTAKEQLFEAKDNDFLLSLPLPPGSILLSRLAELYLVNLLAELSVMIPVTAAWHRNGYLPGLGWLALVIVILLLPLFSLSFSALFGWVLSRLSRRVRKKALFSTVFSLLFLALYLYFYSQVNLLVQQLAQSGAAAAARISAVRPLYWLGQAIAEGNAGCLALTVLFLLLPFAVAYILLSRTFIRTVTARPGAARVEYKARAMKTASPDAALLRRELNGFLSSSSYMVNAGLGLVMLVAGAVALPFFRDRLEETAAQLPGSGSLLFIILLLGVCSLISMVTISAASVSMEGGSLWIAQSLPVSSGHVLRAKAGLHLILTLPAVLLADLSVALVARPRGAELIACILLPLAFALLMGQLGLVANLRHPNLNWTSETQAVKNGVSILIIILLSWGLMVLLGGLTYVLSLIMPLGAALLIVAALLLAGAVLTCRWLSRKGAALFESL